jgi:hypothetical protein
MVDRIRRDDEECLAELQRIFKTKPELPPHLVIIALVNWKNVCQKVHVDIEKSLEQRDSELKSKIEEGDKDFAWFLTKVPKHQRAAAIRERQLKRAKHVAVMEEVRARRCENLFKLNHTEGQKLLAEVAVMNAVMLENAIKAGRFD